MENSSKIILDLCGGSGSWAYFYKQAGYEVHTITLPDNDVRTFHWDGEQVYGIVAAPPCFPAGTLIMTNNGMIPIEDIKVGGKVLTHTGNFRKVLKTGSKLTNEIVKIKSPVYIETTPEHPFLTIPQSKKWDNLNHKWIRDFGEENWKQIKDVSNNDRLCSVIGNYDSNHTFNEDIWEFIGRYVGDGWSRYHNRAYEIFICCGKSEKDELIDLFDRTKLHYRITEQRTTYRFSLCNKELYNFIQTVGKGALNKHIPAILWNECIEHKKAFIKGFLESDGHVKYNKNSVIWQFSSISKRLLLELRQLLFDVYGESSQITYCKRNKMDLIEGRKVFTHDLYILRFLKVPTKKRYDIRIDNKVWYKHKEIKTELLDRPVLVYNLEVDVDNSYVANTYVVHNCESFSNARRDKVVYNPSMDRQTGLDIVNACLRIIDECKPKFWALENPATGDLEKYLGKPTMTFQPYEYGDAYAKSTALWGNFNIPPKIYNSKNRPAGLKGLYVRPGRNYPSLAFQHKSAMYKIPQFAPFYDYIKTDYDLRSITPPKFSYYFYLNNQ